MLNYLHFSPLGIKAPGKVVRAVQAEGGVALLQPGLQLLLEGVGVRRSLTRRRDLMRRTRLRGSVIGIAAVVGELRFVHVQ